MDDNRAIVRSIMEKDTIRNVYFVGCGASRSDLYPAFYFLMHEAKVLRTFIVTAKEFVLATPKEVGPSSIVIACSLAGNTPETVEAAAHASKLGAHVIALTNHKNSPLAQNAEHVVVFRWEESYSSKVDKVLQAMDIACEVLDVVEGYDLYNEFQEGTKRSYPLVDEIALSRVGGADAFAENYKDTELLFVTSSGPMEQIAWSFSMCLMMEMQWIPSSTFNDGDYFHCPFEMTDKNADYLIFLNDGPTRSMDERALTFMRRFNANVTVIDAKEFDLDDHYHAGVKEYFNPVVLAPVERVFAEHIAAVRSHPLSERRYMWKLEY